MEKSVYAIKYVQTAAEYPLWLEQNGHTFSALISEGTYPWCTKYYQKFGPALSRASKLQRKLGVGTVTIVKITYTDSEVEPRLEDVRHLGVLEPV